jgi:hypothetical protein
MKCPHCLVAFFAKEERKYIIEDADGYWWTVTTICPSCERASVALVQSEDDAHTQFGHVPNNIVATTLVRPKGISRAPIPPEVPPEYVTEYREACAVLPDSTMASAALGRRLLQSLLRDQAKVKPGNLADEIQKVIDSRSLPTRLADSIDAVRHAGNFAAHPLKSTQTGLVLPVEPGEAEWTLDVIEELFDHYFVAPARLQAKRDAMNKKLEEAGKPPMKGSV